MRTRDSDGKVRSVTVTAEGMSRLAANARAVLGGQASGQFGGSDSSSSDDGAKSEPADYSRYIPGVAAFFGSEWVESEDLAQLAQDLIGRWPELSFLAGFEIRVLWKAEGGASRGRLLYGKCAKPSGMTKYFALCDWVIWLAADNCRASLFDDRQIEALLYHELKHCAVVGKDAKPGTVGHDFEVFADELRRYGFWNDGRKALGRVVQGALKLDGGDAA